MYDDPENQYQGSYSINLTTGNTFAIGASQMGKTNLLQTIMYDAIRRYGSDEVNFYVIDCGTLAMHVFEDSCYVGGVVGINDEDRIKNLLRLLERTIAERRNLFMQKNVGTYDAYLDLNEGKLPLIVLVIDNIAGFREYYEQYDDTIQMLSREGLSVGISMIVTGSASGNLTYRMSSNFVNKICLTCNDETEYSNLMNVRNMQPYNYPGRALVPLEKRVVEAQFALTHRAESEKDRMAMLQEALEERNRSAVSQAAQIPFVPKELSLKDQMRKNPALFHVPYRIILGMEYETVEYISIALDQTASLIVNGRAGGSKYAAVRAIVNQLQNNILAAPVEAVVMDGRRKHLASLRDISFVRDYITDTAAMRLAISELHEEMEERQRQLYEIEDADERNDLLTKWPLKLLIISDDQAIKLASEDKEIYPMMYDIIAQFEGCKCCILWVDYPNAKATMLSGNDLTRHIGTIGTYLYFDYLSNLKMSELTLQMTRALRRPYVAGDAYWHYEEELKHIRVLTDQE
jgi:S-DNA-T family DNA segregation ATPase FtsK/SpoIIIE